MAAAGPARSYWGLGPAVLDLVPCPGLGLLICEMGTQGLYKSCPAALLDEYGPLSHCSLEQGGGKRERCPSLATGEGQEPASQVLSVEPPHWLDVHKMGRDLYVP